MLSDESADLRSAMISGWNTPSRSANRNPTDELEADHLPLVSFLNSSLFDVFVDDSKSFH